LCDEVEGSPQCNSRHALAPIPPVDEEAGDPVVRELVEPGFVFFAVVDAGQLGRCPVLTPSDRDLAVEYERGVRLAFVNKALLERSVALGAGALSACSAWNQVHQHPPHTPLWRSARSAKCGHVSGPRPLTM
jgi:hypothetical protein